MSVATNSNIKTTAVIFSPSLNLGQEFDVVAFLVHLFNNISDTTKNPPGPVSVVVDYPHALEAIQGSVPAIYIKLIREQAKWISMPAQRQRWYSDFVVGIFSFSVAQRYNLDLQIRNILNSLLYPSQKLANNYVFAQFMGDRIVDNVKLYGTPIYIKELDIQVIYDVLNPPSPKAPIYLS